jgi:hypothetical protein
MSILSVGTELKHQGVKVDILDTKVDVDWQPQLSKLLHHKYDWIGLSVIIGQPMANAAEIQTFIRKELRKPPPIKWGGIMTSVMPDEIKSEYGPDEVCPDQFGKLSAIDWTLLGDRCNKQQQPYYQMIMSSRGCPFSCTFCYKHSIGFPVVEYRSVEDVCAELDWLYKNRGISVFTFGDDNFLTKASRAIAIFDHCREHGYYIEECIGHINNLTEPLIQTMAGIVQTFIFSIETVNPYLQEILKKRVRLHEVKDKMARLASVGIVCNVSFMIGFPGETDSDLRLNRMYMGDLREANPYIRGNCYVWLPLPKTKLSQTAGIPILPVKDYENANFWLRHDDPYGYHFRPHLTEERYHELVEWGIDFNKSFERTASPDGRSFYILGEVLNGEKPRLGKQI